MECAIPNVESSSMMSVGEGTGDRSSIVVGEGGVVVRMVGSMFVVCMAIGVEGGCPPGVGEGRLVRGCFSEQGGEVVWATNGWVVGIRFTSGEQGFGGALRSSHGGIIFRFGIYTGRGLVILGLFGQSG